jgi:hypothetical protein
VTAGSGTVAGASFRVTITDGNHQYKVRASVDGDAMDGSVTRGVGEEYPWHARRSKSNSSTPHQADELNIDILNRTHASVHVISIRSNARPSRNISHQP